MGTLVSAGVSVSSLRSLQFRTAKMQPIKSCEVRCLRKNENSNGLISGPSQMELENHNDTEMFQESFQPPDRELEMKNSDIWKLFKDAQRNILYLNKQRLMAMEELNKTQREKQILIDRIEKLELGKQANMQQEKPAICSELLLRIDSLVLTGMISKGEASNFRRLVTENKVGLLDAFSEIWQKRDSELLEELHLFSDESKRKAFHVIHICTEMAPVVSVGSLGSYVTGLSWALQRKGNLVEIILPKYTSLDLDQVKGLRKVEAEFYSYFNGQSHGNRIWTGVVYGIGVTLIEPIFYLGLFNREKIYGYSDDFERFTYFSRASLDYLVKSGKQPDILHIHNWETAIIGPLFWDIFVNNQGLGSTRILFTCHGFGSQCLEKPDKLALCGLDPSRLHRADRLQDNSKRHLVNILKGGIVYSNKVVMMSSIHSKSRIIRSLSHGLEPTLSIHKEKLLLAPYGLDDTVWDPSKDKHLPAKYSADDTKGKTICKVALLQQLGLSRHASSSTTVVGCIYSNFTDVDIENLKSAFRLASRRGAQFIFMGTSKVESVNTALELFKKEIKDENARFINKYDEALLHLMFAGSDIMLCSSFLDPVLQVPLKAIKYGAAPVDITLNSNRIRHSMDHDLESTRSSQYIMTTFANMSLSEALDQIQSDPSRWDWKIKEGMSKDFSWEAECYDVHLGAYTSIMNV